MVKETRAGMQKRHDQLAMRPGMTAAPLRSAQFPAHYPRLVQNVMPKKLMQNGPVLSHPEVLSRGGAYRMI